MRFFKYLIFLFVAFPVFANAYTYYIQGLKDRTSASSPSAACRLLLPLNPRLEYESNTETKCRVYDTAHRYTSTYDIVRIGEPDPECWHPDYKIVSQNVNNKQIKSSICVSNNGAMCKYVGSVKNITAINGYISTTFESVSKTPDPNCKEELANPPCDPKDPYGGCYTPPNQECTRQFDGSIVCPEEKVPPIEQGCNGADFCNRPPQGCGEGYVSGTYNDERICIKSKPSSGGGSGDGSGDGSGGDLPVTPDLTGILNAINNLSSKIDHYFRETIESIDTMSKKITNNTAETNNLLQQILDKTDTGGDGSSDPSTGQNVDLTETNGLLREIRDGINDIKKVFSDEGKDELEQLGQPSNDSRYTSAESNAQSSLNSLANKLSFSNSSCVSDFQIDIPKFGSVNIALSQWCSLLALLKILIHLAVLLTCIRMIDATVRAI